MTLLDDYLNAEMRWVSEFNEKFVVVRDGVPDSHFLVSGDELAELKLPGAYVITACNPRSEKLSDAQNEVLNHLLAQDLEFFSIDFEEATCGDFEKGWLEKSFLLRHPEGLFAWEFEEVVLALAEKYEQNAVFKFSETERFVVPVLEPRASGSSRYSVGQFYESGEEFIF